MFLTLNLFPCFPFFSAPVVAAFAFRCIAPSYRLSGAFSSFSFYSPSFCSRLRSFRVFFILLFYFPYLTLFSRLFTSFFAPVVFALFSYSGQKMKTCERWLFSPVIQVVSSRSCGFVLPYRRFRVFQFTRGNLPLVFCFVPVMSFALSYRRFRVFQFIRGSLPLVLWRFSSAYSFICRKPV